jgi:hypothetical protein
MIVTNIDFIVVFFLLELQLPRLVAVQSSLYIVCHISADDVIILVTSVLCLRCYAKRNFSSEKETSSDVYVVLHAVY